MLLTGIATGFLGLAAPVSGQAADPTIPEEQDAAQANATPQPAEVTDQEIVVTARRRAEAEMDVPISMTVDTAEELDLRGASDITALQRTNTPSSRNSRTASRLSASVLRSNGVFSSRASPVQLQNAVGTHKVEPLVVSRRNAGEVGSHAV